MKKLEQPDSPGRWLYYPEDDVAPQYAHVWRHSGASVDLICHVIDIHGGLVGRYECEDMPGTWVRVTYGEPPQEKPKPDWLGVPEVTYLNVTWWYEHDGSVKKAVVFAFTTHESLELRRYCRIDGTQGRVLVADLPGKWSPWNGGVKPEPPEPEPEVEKFKTNNGRFLAVTLRNSGESLSALTVEMLCDEIERLTEAEAKEQAP